MDSPEVTLTVKSGMVWAGCSGNGSDGLCDPAQGEKVVTSDMASLFEEGMTFTAIGTKDAFIALMCGNFLPVTHSDSYADVEKESFQLVNPPTRMDADTDTTLVVRAVLKSTGPYSPVVVSDRIDVTALEDCRVSPASATIDATLVAGISQTFDVEFVVNCADPSDHPFTFTATLTGPLGVYDPNRDNNTKQVSTSIEVFDDSDIAVTSTELACDASTMVDEEFTCVGSTDVANNGEYGPTKTDVTLSLKSMPSDCRIVSKTGGGLDDTPIAAGGSAKLENTWTISCEARSNHEFTAESTATVVHRHVDDPAKDNNSGTAEDTVEVFEDVDLEATIASLACTQREANSGDFDCTAVSDITNNGPATAVATVTDVVLDAGAGCTTTPDSEAFPVTLDANQTRQVTATASISCSTPGRHAVTASTTLRNAPSDPHAVDTDTDEAVWVPSDTKPRSFPSSVNIGKQGLVPFALLATADFNPLIDVDVESVLYGATGTEDSVTNCASSGEDVNDDGLLDLVCQADTQKLGATCDTTGLLVTGMLSSGTDFFSQDEVKILGCR